MTDKLKWRGYLHNLSHWYLYTNFFFYTNFKNVILFACLVRMVHNSCAALSCIKFRKYVAQFTWPGSLISYQCIRHVNHASLLSRSQVIKCIYVFNTYVFEVQVFFNIFYFCVWRPRVHYMWSSSHRYEHFETQLFQ